MPAILSPRSTLYLLITLAFTVLATIAAGAQSFSVVYNVGGNPFAGVTIDESGTLYGTTTDFFNCGQLSGSGTVYKLRPEDGSWLYEILGSTHLRADGSCPFGGVIRDANGVLYGTFATASTYDWRYGSVFMLTALPRAPMSLTQKWIWSDLYTFGGGSDGAIPTDTLVFDRAGNLYGTTFEGGDYGCGTAFKLTHSGGTWIESTLYSFMGVLDGCNPVAGMVFDGAGNLYGTTINGGTQYSQGCGTVFEMTPAGSGWAETILHTFSGNGDGCFPQAGVILDGAGNLYGATVSNNIAGGGGGTVFELTPTQRGQGYTYNLIYSFSGSNGGVCPIWGQASGSGPASSLSIDNAGNLYGTTQADGAYGYGNVFKLSYSDSQWTYASLHDFNNDSSGAHPCGSVAFDQAGNLYGTTWDGLVWEIMP